MRECRQLSVNKRRKAQGSSYMTQALHCHFKHRLSRSHSVVRFAAVSVAYVVVFADLNYLGLGLLTVIWDY